jgi:type I restriction enzyme S subunit
VRLNDSVDPRYVSHFFQTKNYWSQVALAARGAAQAGVNASTLRAVKVPVVPLLEQRRVADVLDRAEELRAKRRAARALVDTLTQSIFLDLFGEPSTNPMGWERLPIGALISMGPQNGLYKPSSEYGRGTPILRIDAFYNGSVTDLASLKRVELSEGERSNYGLRPGDIVINRVNSREYLGKSALIPTLMEPTVFESNMMRLRLDESRIDPMYAVQFLQSGYIRSQIAKASKDAVNQSSINQQDVQSFQINVPPLMLQREFAERVSHVEKLKAGHRASAAQLDVLFASLQQRAFRGEL